jgi:isoleucyl-tRNA synthetase
MSTLRDELVKENEGINWEPSYIKEGRFGEWLKDIKDWAISRERYWGTPLPVWICNDCNKREVLGSIDEIKSRTKKSGNKYFVMRHGEAENNVLNVVSSNLNNAHHLTEKGKKQTLEAIKILKNKNIDMIFNSPFMRAKETTKIISESLDFLFENTKEDLRLSELNDGIFSNGSPAGEVHEFLENNHLDRYDGACEDGESLIDVKKRVGEFIYEIDQKYQNKNILIVTHEDTGYALFSVVNGWGKEETTKEAKNSPPFLNAEIRELDFISLPHNHNYELDLHRPYIDDVPLVCAHSTNSEQACGGKLTRVSEVLDCWFESGSMPFAQDHYPFENKEWQKNNFPAGFVAEYIGQVRTWFYYTHVVSTILFNQAPFENIVTTGTVRAEDGEKMSKSKNNYPDPWKFINKYGADALRIYLMSSTLMKGEDANFSEKAVQDIASKIIGRLFNVLTFYELYRDPQLEVFSHVKSDNVLDQWILSRLDQTLVEITKGMEGYDMAEATRPIDSLIDELSTWYLRRSRERIKEGENEAKQTLYFVLKALAKILAPFAPFTAEEMWLKLKNENDVESVHLVEWPKAGEINYEIIEEMNSVRAIVTLGLEARQKAGIKVRQPLATLKLKVEGEKLSSEYTDLIKDEINVKEIIYDNSIENEVELNIVMTEELKEEGSYRELVRALQDMRKGMGLTPSDVVSIVFETNEIGKKLVEKFQADMKKTVLVSKVNFAENDGEEVKIDDLVFKVKIKK